MKPSWRWFLGLLVVLTTLSASLHAHAEDGGNEVCPAIFADADDVRERYDEQGKLVHQLRLKGSSVVQEIAILHQSEHAVARSEVTSEHLRVARTRWDEDHVVSAECYLDGVRIAYATYRYEDDRVVRVEKHFWDKPADSGAAPAVERIETVHFAYDADGRLVATEVRRGDGTLLSRTRAERAPPRVPVQVALSAGGSYQSDTDLYDLNAGLGIRRRPRVQRYGSDPLDVGLDAVFKFHRVAGLTSTDQTRLRLSVDYHDILPRFTIFTFTNMERNLPANLRLNLEVAVLGAKFDILPGDKYQLDVSFAPVWNFRSIVSPTTMGTSVDENTSKLRGSFRARAGISRETWSLLDTLEFLPTLFGDDVVEENDFWSRSVLRNTVALNVSLSRRFTLREEFRYTRDPAMRAQANCPDSSNPLCRGYSFASTTSLVLNLEL
ncbi:MAG: hypothetical protein ACOY0T_38455 [Myxococcota bacterium]